MAEEHGLLAGIRVIDCATYVAGPAAATVMSDFGAMLDRGVIAVSTHDADSLARP